MKKYLLYYAALTTLVLTAIFHTVFVGSVFVGHGSTVSALEADKFELKQQTQQLAREVTGQTALNQLQLEAEASGYQPISRPVAVIDSGSEVALR